MKKLHKKHRARPNQKIKMARSKKATRIGYGFHGPAPVAAEPPVPKTAAVAPAKPAEEPSVEKVKEGDA